MARPAHEGETKRMKWNRITALVRPVDPSYPTNLAIGLVTLVVAVGGMLVQLATGASPAESRLWGLSAGVTVFLTWALGRELDPDHPLSAFVGVGLALIGAILWGTGGLGLLFWLLLVMRVVNRTPGRPATALDLLGVIALGAWQTYGGWWGVGVMTAVAVALDWWLRPGREWGWAFTLLALLAGGVALALGEGMVGADLTWWAGGLALALAALLIPVYRASGQLVSVGDATGEPLSPTRVRAAQLVASLAGVLGALDAGAAGLRTLLPFWAAVAGAALYWMVMRAAGRYR
jgi:hypothetical protein